MPSVFTHILSGSHPQMLSHLHFLDTTESMSYDNIQVLNMNLFLLQVVNPQLQTMAERSGGGGGGWNRSRYGTGRGGGSFKRGSSFGGGKGPGHKRFNEY